MRPVMLCVYIPWIGKLGVNVQYVVLPISDFL